MIFRCQPIYTADAYGRNGCRFTVLADGRLTAFLELRAAIQRQNVQTIAEGSNKVRQTVADRVKNLLGCVIRRFNESSAGLKKPVGLDLRWYRRLTRSSRSNWSPESAEVRPLFKSTS
jgi:hypothetical protein